MVLTNSRLDCVRLALDLIFHYGENKAFDKIVFLLNAVSDRHMRGIDAYIQAHPEVSWDKVIGNGTRPQGIADMQNRCIERYPDSLYMKIDEDVFVPRGWAARMIETYETYQSRNDLGLISPLIPNNAMGLHTLLTRFYPEHLEAHRRIFQRDPDPERASFTWHNPYVAQWATRLFIDLDRANAEQRARLASSGAARFLEFSRPFSIGCICYDYALWKKMGGIPPTDEPGWCKWIEENGHINVLDCSQIALHYSFFVQQEWLDRSNLVEDLRIANLPDTTSGKTMMDYHMPRACRVIRQIPGILRRRLLKNANH
jgi:hypothetical protein